MTKAAASDVASREQVMEVCIVIMVEGLLKSAQQLMPWMVMVSYDNKYVICNVRSSLMIVVGMKMNPPERAKILQPRQKHFVNISVQVVL